MDEHKFREKQERFTQKLTEFLEQHNPDLLKEWEEVQELQDMPLRIKAIRWTIEDSISKIRTNSLIRLWRAYEDLLMLPEDQELARQAKALQQFINDVDNRIEAFKEELEGPDTSSLKYWQKIHEQTTHPPTSDDGATA